MQNDRTEAYRQLLAEVRAEIVATRPRLEAAMRELAGLEDQERHLSALCGEKAETGEARSTTGDTAEGGVAAAAEEETRASGTVLPSPQRHDGESFAAGVRRVAREAIRAAGRPLNRAQICEAVSRDGIELPDRNAARKISKILSADEGLENVRGEGYSLG